MKEISEAMLAALGTSSRLSITIDDGISLELENEGLGKALAGAIRNHLAMQKRTTLRRKSFESVIASDRHGKALMKHFANGKKWQFVSSHSARISFATNLSLAGMPLQHICSAMGHLNSATTLHYIVSSDYALTVGAQQYLG